MKSFRALSRQCARVLALTGCWLLLTSCSTLTPTDLEDKERKLADKEVVLPMIAAPAEGRRCDGVSGNTHIVTASYNPHINKQQPQTYYHETEEPIQSSIAVATDFLLVGKFDRSRSVERQYFEASARHDLCYQHGASTYGRKRGACDDRIFADMYRLCGMANNGTGWGRASCNYRPQLVSAAVSTFGGVFSTLTGSSETNNICEYEPGGFQPARDHLVIGHFEEAPGTEQILELSAVKLRAGESCKGGLVLQGRLISANLTSREVFRLCPSEIPLANDNAGRNLRDLNITVPDLLSHAPVRARLESPGQAIDDLVLVAFHTGSMRGAEGGDGYGTIMIPIRLGARENIRAFQVRHGQSTEDLGSGACVGGDSRGCWISQKKEWLAREREMLTSPLYHAHVMPRCGAGISVKCENGEQLLSVHTYRGGSGPAYGDGGGGGIVAIATFAFRYREDRGFDLIGVNSDIIHSEPESYKRFQHPPLMFDDNGDGRDDIHFLFRDPSEITLTTLMVESYRPVKSPGSMLDMAWSIKQGAPAKASYGGVAGWSRESYVWMTLGKTASSLGGEDHASKEMIDIERNPGVLVSEFLSNCFDYAGKHCSGRETIRIRLVAEQDMMLSPQKNEKKCVAECDVSCPDKSCVTSNELSLYPSSPKNNPRYVKDYMKLPVLTGTFGSENDIGPGLLFFKTKTADRLNVLQVWKPRERVQWQAQEYACRITNDGQALDAWETLRAYPLEVISNGPGKPSTLLLSRRSSPTGVKSAANSLPPEIKYSRFDWSGGKGEGVISCELKKKKKWDIYTFGNQDF